MKKFGRCQNKASIAIRDANWPNHQSPRKVKRPTNPEQTFAPSTAGGTVNGSVTALFCGQEVSGDAAKADDAVAGLLYYLPELPPPDSGQTGRGGRARSAWRSLYVSDSWRIDPPYRCFPPFYKSRTMCVAGAHVDKLLHIPIPLSVFILGIGYFACYSSPTVRWRRAYSCRHATSS